MSEQEPAFIERRSGVDRRAIARGGRRATDLPTTQQRRVLTVIEQYASTTGEACPAAYIARRLSLHHSTIQEHLSALYRKGWLRTPNAPATLEAVEE